MVNEWDSITNAMESRAIVEGHVSELRGVVESIPEEEWKQVPDDLQSVVLSVASEGVREEFDNLEGAILEAELDLGTLSDDNYGLRIESEELTKELDELTVSISDFAATLSKELEGRLLTDPPAEVLQWVREALRQADNGNNDKDSLVRLRVV